MLFRAEKEVGIAASPETFFEVVWAFERYPEFVTGVAATRVISRTAAEARVEMTAKLMGVPFRYELQLVKDEARQVRWHRVAGAFARAEGAWTLVEKRDGQSFFRYENAVDPGLPAPGFIVQYVLNTALPTLLADFKKRVEAHEKTRAAAPAPEKRS